MTARAAAAINRIFDRAVHPRLRVGRRSWSRYMVCGYTGLALAIALAMGLATATGLSRWLIAGNVLAAVVAYLLVANVTRLVTGEKQLTYYHHEVAVLALVAGLDRLSGQPVLPYLDISIVAVGMFLACGRVGCLMSGCCHGRPWPWGVRYGDEHARAGYRRAFMDARLFPVQALESALVLAIVTAGSALVLGNAEAGAALSLYVAGYGAGRFALEFLRGDPDRRHLLRVSEAQWTSAGSALALVAAEAAGLLAFHPWHAAVAAALTAAALAVAVGGKKM